MPVLTTAPSEWFGSRRGADFQDTPLSGYDQTGSPDRDEVKHADTGEQRWRSWQACLGSS